jgi:hypothetical protein
MCIYDNISLNSPQKEKCFRKKNRREKQFFYVQFFFRKSCSLWGNLEKYSTARHATGDKTIQRKKDAICLPDNYGKATDKVVP